MSYQQKRVAEFAVELFRRQPWLTAAQVSEKLHVHRHTLQRALKATGTSYALIKQAFVLECLERHFASPKAISLKQVWTELGFASASAFARYIRHATGKSPSELRVNWRFDADKVRIDTRSILNGESSISMKWDSRLPFK